MCTVTAPAVGDQLRHRATHLGCTVLATADSASPHLGDLEGVWVEVDWADGFRSWVPASELIP